MKSHLICGLLVACAAALLHIGPVHGQSAAALQNRLETAERLHCRFPVLSTGIWDAGQAAANVSESALQLQFFDINTDEGSAEVEGTFGGASFISARYTQGYLHLMQVSSSGPVYITTVLAREASDGRLMAVHVRLEYVPTILPGFTSRPEMYVGSCAIES